VYYVVAGTGKGLRATVCFEGISETYDSRIMSVYSGTCSTLRCTAIPGGSRFDVANVTDIAECGERVGFSIDFGTSEADGYTDDYFFRVADNLAASDFTISVTEFENASNDNCYTAIELSGEGSFTAEIDTAIATRDIVTGDCAGPEYSIFAGEPSGVWFTVEGTGDVMRLMHSPCDLEDTAPEGEFSFAVYDGTCGSCCLHCVGQYDFSKVDLKEICGEGSGSRKAISWVSSWRKQYYILVQAAESASYEMYLDIVATADAPSSGSPKHGILVPVATIVVALLLVL